MERKRREEFEQQLGGLTNFVQSELATVREGKARNRTHSIAGVEMMLGSLGKVRTRAGRKSSIIGVENMLQSIDQALVHAGSEASTPEKAKEKEKDREAAVLSETMAQWEQRFTLLEEKLSKIVDLAGGSASVSESTKAKRKLFSKGEAGGAAAVTVGTQTDEVYSHYLHTAETMESLSYSICRRVAQYLEERLLVPGVRIGGSVREDLRSGLAEDFDESKPSISGLGLLPDLRALSSPVSDPIFADEINVPKLNSNFKYDYVNEEQRTPREVKRQELAQMVRSLDPPFTKSPKSKGLRVMHSERHRRNLFD
ncbi:hypothetical protein HOP50_01g05480 [Chloropicon primus]|nr:hypothetical protein HOP50_01g05480 [Chloropicon primus]